MLANLLIKMYTIKVKSKEKEKKGGSMEELNLKELFEIFWSKKVQIILIVLIFAVIGVIYTMGFVTPVYTSSTTLVLAGSENEEQTATTTNSITTTDITINSKLVSTYSVIVKSKDVLEQVISNLGINTSWESLRNNVAVSSVEDTEVIEISVTNSNPQYAADLANEIANVFKDKVSDIYNINNVHIVDEAEVDNIPSNINHSRDVIIFAFIGVVVAVVYVLIANMLDTTIKSADDIERLYKLPVLASIPIYGLDMQKKKKKGGRK